MFIHGQGQHHWSVGLSVSTACRERGLLLNAVRPGTLRLAPPLTVSASEVDAALLILQEVLAEASSGDLHAN
jgi:acetylornithine aminotransferase